MRLRESITAIDSRLDRDRGIVRGVKILGFYSEHGYEYTPEAMKRAIPLYEGVTVNLDHPQRSRLRESRSYADRFGRLRNVRYEEGRGLVGDLHYNRQHRIAAQFEYDVEHSPENVGLSHNASGHTVRDGDRTLIDAITVVRSVDLVADPATNVSLFESRNERRRRPLVRWLTEIRDELLEQRRAGFDERDSLEDHDLELDEPELPSDSDEDDFDEEDDDWDGDPLENFDLELDDEEELD